MSISAIAKYFDLDWRTVKNVEKRYLKKKFKRIKLKNVRIIGIDEIFVSRKKENEKIQNYRQGFGIRSGTACRQWQGDGSPEAI
jgi:hypothetical protein